MAITISGGVQLTGPVILDPTGGSPSPSPGGGGASNFGYSLGGTDGNPSTVIDKFSFASDGNATDVGDALSNTIDNSGQSSSTHGYSTGSGTPTDANGSIQKFAFATDGNTSLVGSLSVKRGNGAAGSSSSSSGYTAGGRASGNNYNIIDKFPFASDDNASDVGDLTATPYILTGQNSADSGYASGGNTGPTGTPAWTTVNIIEKFPFASDGNATDVGDLTEARSNLAGQSSTTDGYCSGGQPTPANLAGNVIDKFPFASDSNASDVGDITVSRRAPAGTSSNASGYCSGGEAASGSPAIQNVIDKFPFASDGNATDVGDLTGVRYLASGAQY